MVGGLYNVNPDKFGVTDNYRTYSPAYGNISQVYNGVDINVNARLRNGLQLQGGHEHRPAGHRLVCGARANCPNKSQPVRPRKGGIAYSPANPYCHVAPGITTRATLAGTYIIPKIDVQFAGTLTSSPAYPLQANWAVSERHRAAVAGRDLSGSAPNVTVNLLAPGQMRSDRVNILDFRVGKVLRFGRSAGAHRARSLQRAQPGHGAGSTNFTYPAGAWLVPPRC